MTIRWRVGLSVFCLLLILSGCGAQETAQGYQSITPEAAYEALNDEAADILLLDVRTEKEYNEKHIPKSILLPLNDLDKQAEALLPDKEAVIYVYCRSGSRSQKAAQWLAEAGYTQVYDLGGSNSWPYETE